MSKADFIKALSEGIAKKRKPRKGRKRVTVANPQRVAYPDIYKDAREIRREVEARMAPEDPALLDLFGVNRYDLHDMEMATGGTKTGVIPGRTPRSRGARHAEQIMTPENTRRLIDLLEVFRGSRIAPGMESWYEMDPAYVRLLSLVDPEEAKRLYTQLNALTSNASPGSEVLTELRRGTVANRLAEEGRFDLFEKYGGVREDKRGPRFPRDLLRVPGHSYHSTAHAPQMRKFLERGELPDSPKVPMYFEASQPSLLGRQRNVAIGDAHYSRGVGLADVRNMRKVKGKLKIPGQSVSTPEMVSLEDWWRDDVAAQVGLDPVPAQALQWGALSRATGVDTPVGAGKLELLAGLINRKAKERGVDPAELRDRVLMGKDDLAALLPVGAGGLITAAAVAPEDAEAGVLGAVNAIAKSYGKQTLKNSEGAVNVPGRGWISFGDDEKAIEAARRYAERNGFEYRAPDTYVPVDEHRAKAIADEFDLMRHAPDNPVVASSYDKMIEETREQFEEMLRQDVDVRFDDNYPYRTPREALIDLHENNRLHVFPTRQGFGSNAEFDPADNPLLRETDILGPDGRPLLANDLFRAVHDYFGHQKHGVGFRARGEENAWQSHAGMYSPEARRAMTTETRGQNSWLNYGPHGERNRTASTDDTIFADQKIGLLPRWASESGRNTAHERRRRFERDLREGNTGLEGAIDPETGMVRLAHYSWSPLERTDPSQYGSGLSRRTIAERNRAYDPRFEERTYFGVEDALDNPYRRELGLGNVRHEALFDPELIYPLNRDPENLRVAGDPTGTERAVTAAGYSGYLANDPRIGKVVAMFDPVFVKRAERGEVDPRLLTAIAAAAAGGSLTLGSEDAEAGVVRKLADELALPVMDVVEGIRAYHGSPRHFDRVDPNAEVSNSQAFGKGFYSADAEPTAMDYRPEGGAMYEVQLNVDPRDLLSWEDPLSEQPKALQELWASAWRNRPPDGQFKLESGEMNPEVTGSEIYERLSRMVGGDAEASEVLMSAGVPGAKYRDMYGRRTHGVEGANNYVIYDANLIDILRKYGIAAAAVPGIAAMSTEDAEAAGLGAVKKALDMTYAPRMERASDQGHYTGMNLYHGTGSDIREFDLSKGGDTSRSPVGRLGVSVALDPETAGEFANLAASKEKGAGANVMQLLHRADNPARIDLAGDETNLEIAGAVQDAWDAGHDAIMFTNYTTPGGATGKSFIMVKDPSQLRSVNAAFDPDKRDSADLLASLTGTAGAAGLAAAAAPQEAEAAPVRSMADQLRDLRDFENSYARAMRYVEGEGDRRGQYGSDELKGTLAAVKDAWLQGAEGLYRGARAGLQEGLGTLTEMNPWVYAYRRARGEMPYIPFVNEEPTNPVKRALDRRAEEERRIARERGAGPVSLFFGSLLSPI